MRCGWVGVAFSISVLGCTDPDAPRSKPAEPDAVVLDAASDAGAFVPPESGSPSGIDASLTAARSASVSATSSGPEGVATDDLPDASTSTGAASGTLRDAGEQDGAGLGDGALAPSAYATTSVAPSRQDPFSLPEKCTSGQYWKEGSGETMRPGEACIACHNREYGGPVLTFAGTVYARGHEPDDCLGVLPADGIVVEITDAANRVFKLSTNAAGNFLRSASVTLPYTARVLSVHGERRMLTPQMDGDCNGCHSSRGNNGAPGRIAVP